VKMKKLSEIIDYCKKNKEVDAYDLIYAVVALTYLLNMANSKLLRFYKNDMNKLDKLILENHYKACNAAMNKPPKEWIGWTNDPENPECQEFHSFAEKLVDKAIKGELPNQKAKAEVPNEKF